MLSEGAGFVTKAYKRQACAAVDCRVDLLDVCEIYCL